MQEMPMVQTKAASAATSYVSRKWKNDQILIDNSTTDRKLVEYEADQNRNFAQPENSTYSIEAKDPGHLDEYYADWSNAELHMTLKIASTGTTDVVAADEMCYEHPLALFKEAQLHLETTQLERVKYPSRSDHIAKIMKSDPSYIGSTPNWRKYNTCPETEVFVSSVTYAAGPPEILTIVTNRAHNLKSTDYIELRGVKVAAGTLHTAYNGLGELAVTSITDSTTFVCNLASTPSSVVNGFSGVAHIRKYEAAYLSNFRNEGFKQKQEYILGVGSSSYTYGVKFIVPIVDIFASLGQPVYHNYNHLKMTFTRDVSSNFFFATSLTPVVFLYELQVVVPYYQASKAIAPMVRQMQNQSNTFDYLAFEKFEDVNLASGLSEFTITLAVDNYVPEAAIFTLHLPTNEKNNAATMQQFVRGSGGILNQAYVMIGKQQYPERAYTLSATTDEGWNLLYEEYKKMSGKWAYQTKTGSVLKYPEWKNVSPIIVIDTSSTDKTAYSQRGIGQQTHVQFKLIFSTTLSAALQFTAYFPKPHFFKHENRQVIPLQTP